MNKKKLVLALAALFILLLAGILVNRPDIARSRLTNAPTIITPTSIPASTGMEKQLILQDLGMT